MLYKDADDFVVIYDDCETWDSVVLIRFTNNTAKVMYGDDKEGKTEMNRMLNECKTDRSWRRVGSDRRDHLLYAKLLDIIDEKLKGEEDSRGKKIVCELERYKEI